MNLIIWLLLLLFTPSIHVGVPTPPDQLWNMHTQEELLIMDMEEYISDYIRIVNPGVENPEYIASIIVEKSIENGLDPFVVSSLTKHESTFEDTAQSITNAIGLLQILQSTANLYGFEKDLWNPENNMEFGCFYLSDLYGSYGLEKALRFYNTGTLTDGTAFARSVMHTARINRDRFETLYEYN